MARREFERSVYLALELTALRPRRLTYSVLSLKPESNQVRGRSGKGQRGDKTGWTKARSRRAASAMGIVSCAVGRHLAKDRMGERRLRAVRLFFSGLGPYGAGLFFGTHRRTRAKQADRESMSLGGFEPLS